MRIRGGRILTVDGERFRVRLRPRRRAVFQCDYDWLTGPNREYGFSVSSSCAQSDEEQKAAIRNFLAQIDPATGYLAED
jgi:hypothetical protein